MSHFYRIYDWARRDGDETVAAWIEAAAVAADR